LKNLIDNKYIYDHYTGLSLAFLISKTTTPHSNKLIFHIRDEKGIPYSKEYVKQLKKACDTHLGLDDKYLFNLIETENNRQKKQQAKDDATLNQELKDVMHPYIPGYIYLLRSKLGYKIGKSKTKKRPEKLSTILLPIKISIVFCSRVFDYNVVEKWLLEQYSSCIIKGEWFKLTCRNVADIIKYVEEYRIPA